MRRPPVLLLLTSMLLLSPMFGQSESEITTVAEVDGERISLQELRAQWATAPRESVWFQRARCM